MIKPSFDKSSLPLFWKGEQSGRMKEIVFKFLDNKELNEEELAIIKWYIKQYTEGIGLNEDHDRNDPSFIEYEQVILEALVSLEEAKNNNDIMKVINKLLEVGIDPL